MEIRDREREKLFSVSVLDCRLPLLRICSRPLLSQIIRVEVDPKGDGRARAVNCATVEPSTVS